MLFDLTNTYTYFEGNPVAFETKHSASKEKRRDRPLVILALVIDENGLAKWSKFFPVLFVIQRALHEKAFIITGIHFESSERSSQDYDHNGLRSFTFDTHPSLSQLICQTFGLSRRSLKTVRKT
ncbi:MAG: hypothetical protein WHS38_06965 [Thermodesulforhabdaceae bacterium]